MFQGNYRCSSGTVRLAVIVLCFFVAAVAYSQTDSGAGLVLRGRVYDTQKVERNDSIVWKARLAMEFVNQGSKPVILVNPTLQAGTGLREVVFVHKQLSSSLHYGDERIALTRKIEPKPDETATIKAWGRDFQQGSPPANLTMVLKPGESFEFTDVLEVEQKFTYSTEQGARYKSWEGGLQNEGPFIIRKFGEKDYAVIDRGYPVELMFSIQLKYSFEIDRYSDSPTLFDTLVEKWKSVGTLPLDKDGAYSITSEPINIYKVTWSQE